MTDHVNRRAAAAIGAYARANGLSAADQRLLMDMCGLVAPDGSIPPDDVRSYDIVSPERTAR